MQHFHEWVWLDRDLTRIWMCRIERCTQWLHSVHSCCAFALMLSKYYTFLLCLHTFVKYDECMQHFHEWVWLDRDLTRIWMCRIERCTQWLHSVHSCCAWCSDVFKILHISIVFAHLCKIWRVYAALSWVSMIRSGFDTHLNVQNRKMYAMVTLCTFLLRFCSDVIKILHISIVFAHLCKIWRVYAALSWVSMIRSGFDTHLNVQNRKMYAMVTLCTFLLRLVLWHFQNTAHFYCVCTPL